MLRKEIASTLRQTAYVACFSLLLPVVYWINQIRLESNMSFVFYLQAGTQLLYSILLLTLSYNMFADEDRDGAKEYLLSLPLSRKYILGAKLLPRLVVSLICLALLIPVGWGWGSEISIAARFYFFRISLVPVLAVLLSGFLLGISQRSNPFLAVLLLLPVLYWLLPGFHARMNLNMWMIRQGFRYNLLNPATPMLLFSTCKIAANLLAWTVPTLLPAAVLMPFYKEWTCSSGKVRAERMMKRLMLPSLLLIVITVLTFS